MVAYQNILQPKNHFQNQKSSKRHPKNKRYLINILLQPNKHFSRTKIHVEAYLRSSSTFFFLNEKQLTFHWCINHSLLHMTKASKSLGGLPHLESYFSLYFHLSNILISMTLVLWMCAS